MSALRAPFIMTVVAPTGSGKTHNTTQMAQHFKTGALPLVHRFLTKKNHPGDPFKFSEIHYIGLIDDTSIDEQHNQNIRNLIASGKNPGSAVTLQRLAAMYAIPQEDPRMRNYKPIMEPENPASLIPQYISQIADRHSTSQRQCGPLIILDDMAAVLPDMSNAAKTMLKSQFQAGSHHKGLSFMVLYQKVPEDKLSSTLMQSSHYFMFPIPPIMGGSDPKANDENIGVSVGDFRTIMHGVHGRSKTYLANFEDKVRLRPRPNYIIYNKTSLLTDRELLGEAPIATPKDESDVDDESEKLHLNKK